jgi:glycosyltransferase involved in cell wall biosynthesis
MRVLRVITRLDVHGGAELSTLIELEELAARGHDVLVVTVAEATTPAAVQRLERAGVEHRHLSGDRVRQVLALRSAIGSWRPDLLHAVIWAAEVVTAAAALGRRVPTLVSLVNMQYAPEAVAQAPSPRRLDAVRRVEGLVVRHGFDHVHCLTEAGAEHSVEHLGVRRDRITVIPRGRRAQDLAVDAARVTALRADLLQDATMLVLNVGRHESQKGQDLLVEALSRLDAARRGLRVVVAGREGNGTAALRSQIAALGLDDVVQLLGARRDVPELLAAADVVAVTSRWEGLGGSIIETLGAGAPIVGFGVPAVREVVGDAAVLVAPFDVGAFAEAVSGLVEDAPRRARLAELARRRFDEHFEIRAVVDRIEHLYRDLVAQA